jgi:hypothetical protein
MEYLIEHVTKTKRRQNDEAKKIKYKLGKFVDLFCNIYIISNIYLDMQLKKECLVLFQKVHHQDNVFQLAMQDFAKKKKNIKLCGASVNRSFFRGV